MNPNTPQPTDQPEVPAVPTTDTPVVPETNETPVPSTESPAVETPTAEPAAADTPVSSPFGTPAESQAPVTPSAPGTPGVAPETPSAFGSAPGAPLTTPPGAPKNNKKLITIIAAAAGVVVLAVIAVIVFLAMTTVSKQDYAAAAGQFTTVSSANSSLTRSVSALSSGVTDEDAEFNTAVKNAEDAIAKLKSENDELGKLKAVKVGEGGDLYKTFDGKLEAYLEYGSGLITSVKNVRPALITCDAISDANDAAARVTALKACSEALGKVNDIPNAEFKTYIGALKTEYASYATTYEKMAAITNPYGAQYEEYKTVRDQMYDILDNISAATKTFTSGLNQRDKDLSVKDSANALADYLNEQQRK